MDVEQNESARKRFEREVLRLTGAGVCRAEAVARLHTGNPQLAPDLLQEAVGSATPAEIQGILGLLHEGCLYGVCS